MYLLYSGLFDKIRRNYFRRVIHKFVTSPGARLLDYGCGPGDMLLVCNSMGVDAIGIDNSKRSVELAQSRGVAAVLGDIDSLPPEMTGFDAIFVQSVIEHVSDPVSLTQRLSDRLKENGVLILSAPTPGPFFWDDPTHVRPYTPKSFQTLSEICGLEIIEINYVFSFLLGFRTSFSLFYRLLNLQPISLGSNLIAVYRKRSELMTKTPGLEPFRENESNRNHSDSRKLAIGG